MFSGINCIYDYIAVHYTCIYCVIPYYLSSINFQTLNNQHNVIMTAPFPPPFPNTLINRTLFTRGKKTPPRELGNSTAVKPSEKVMVS